MTDDEKLVHCRGCEQNFYNGNNSLGVTRCWSLESMVLVERKKVHRDAPPPWLHESEQLPNCYQQKEYVILKGNPTEWSEVKP